MHIRLLTSEGTLILYFLARQVCVCRYDWETFPDRFAEATNIDEMNFYEYLIDVVQPQVTAVFRVRLPLLCRTSIELTAYLLARPSGGRGDQETRRGDPQSEAFLPYSTA